MTLPLNHPKRDRTLTVEVKCSECGLVTDIDPKDDRDCFLCHGIGTLERRTFGGQG